MDLVTLELRLECVKIEANHSADKAILAHNMGAWRTAYKWSRRAKRYMQEYFQILHLLYALGVRA